MTTGEKVRQFREGKKMQMQELAELSGLSISAISRIEKGFREPTVKTIIKLANAMGVTAWDLIKNDT